MAKQNFTPAWVQVKTAELYALTAPLLAQQAAAMRGDFKSWLTSNFSLDTSQTAYLNKMDSRSLTAAGDEVALATTERLAVELVAPRPPGTFSSKDIKRNDPPPSTKYDSVGGYSITWKLIFTIGYTVQDCFYSCIGTAILMPHYLIGFFSG